MMPPQDYDPFAGLDIDWEGVTGRKKHPPDDTIIGTNDPHNNGTKDPTKNDTITGTIPRILPTMVPRMIPKMVSTMVSTMVPKKIVLTGQQNKVFRYLIEHSDTGLTKAPEIAKRVGIPIQTVRHCLKKLKDLRLISYETYIVTGFRGIRFTINQEGPSAGADKKRGSSQEWYQQPYQGSSQEWYHSPHEEDNIYNNLPQDNQDPTNNDTKDPHKNGIIPLDVWSDTKTMYPELHVAGIERKQVLEIAKIWSARGLNLSELGNSLEMAEFDIKNNPKIEQPGRYAMTALKNGPYSRPRGFRSARERQLLDQKEELDRIRALGEEILEEKFEIWWENLTKEGRAAVDSLIARKNPACKTAKGELLRAARLAHFIDPRK